MKRGAPPLPHKELLWMTAWKKVQETMHLRQSNDVQAACKHLVQDGYRIIRFEGFPKPKTISTVSGLRDWHYKFERLRHAQPEREMVVQANAWLSHLRDPARMETLARNREALAAYDEWEKRGFK